MSRPLDARQHLRIQSREPLTGVLHRDSKTQTPKPNLEVVIEQLPVYGIMKKLITLPTERQCGRLCAAIANADDLRQRWKVSAA